MKAKDASRAATLVAALRSVESFVKAAQDSEAPPTWQGHFTVGELGERNALGGPVLRGLVMLDLETTVMVGQIIYETVKRELDGLGVTLD